MNPTHLPAHLPAHGDLRSLIDSSASEAIATVPTLRERRKRATEIEISEAALELFEQNGVAATTVGDIARAAGISERTFFRYFSSKEETVLDFQQWFRGPTLEWLAAVGAAFAGDDVSDASAGPADEPIIEQFENVCVGVLRQLDGPNRDAADRLRRIRTLMRSEPSLRAVSAMLDDERASSVADRIVEAFAGRVTVLEARLAAEIVGVGLRAACQTWSARLDAGEDATLEDAYRIVRGTIHSLTAAPS